jgi:hypothetical protein
MTAVEYDDLDEKEQANIKSLPTIRMKGPGSPDSWTVYTADTIEEWKTDIIKRSHVVDTDF